MPRETKQQRMEREAIEQAALEARLIAEYPYKLMSILERATKSNFELKVCDGKFRVVDLDNPRDGEVHFSVEYSQDDHDALLNLEWRVKLKEEAGREMNRQRLLKQSALAKLSPEERDVLGF